MDSYVTTFVWKLTITCRDYRKVPMYSYKKNCQGRKEKEVCDFTMISMKVKKSQACKRKKVSNITSYQTAYQRKKTTIHPKRHRKQSHDQKDYVLL